jgi:hypothetical protein
MQKSREFRKISELRVYSSCGTAGKVVKEFGIEQRDRERKEKMLNGHKVLFYIRVEVGKREYRLKVREGMVVTEVVQTIELMVGFKHPSLEEIVKGYFINWEMKKNNSRNPLP